MLVTLLTPTGGRQKIFERCEYYMQRQTWKDRIQWIVIDDCDPPTTCTLGQEYYRGPMKWEEGVNTQRANMDLALSKAKGECILVIEDDDWYHPTYIERMVECLKVVPIVGEANNKYYNVESQGYKEMRNVHHASLCQTGITRTHARQLFEAIHSGELYFDIVFWSRAESAGIPRILFFDANLAIGLKRLPGRFGIGAGHTKKDYMFDPDWTKLTEWVGKDDTEFYKQFSTLKLGQVVKFPSDKEVRSR